MRNSKTFIVLNCIVLTTSAIRLRLIELRFIIQGEGKIVNVPSSREMVGCFFMSPMKFDITYGVTEAIQLLVFLFLIF